MPSRTLSNRDGAKVLLSNVVGNRSTSAELKSFVCDEVITRYRLTSGSGRRHNIDRLTAQVSLEKGREDYSRVKQNGHRIPSLRNLKGAWSTGEYATLLEQTLDLLQSRQVTRQDKSLLDNSLVSFGFEVSVQDSPWLFTFEGGREYKLPFRTKVWVSETSGEIVKILRTATELPPETGIAQLQWEVNLQWINLDGHAYLVPTKGRYEVRYKESSECYWNDLSFSNYNRYSALSKLSFE